MERRFLLLFFLSLFVLMMGVFIFVSWVDPMRTIGAPWRIPFVSDRNSSYIKYIRMVENQVFTELIVGSSTSEVFAPQMIQDNFGHEAFLAGDGGASTSVRYLYVKKALEVNPRLRHVIYVADLFEFKDLSFENQVYYQTEMMSVIDPEVQQLTRAPDPLLRLYDLISQKALREAFKTLNDYAKFKSGEYTSQYRHDGSTAKTMLDYKSDEPLKSRVARQIRSYQTIYGDMNKLNANTAEVYKKLVGMVRARGVTMSLLIAPWHPDFHAHYMPLLQKNNLHSQWVSFLQSLAGDGVQVFEFQLPPETSDNWHDGVHFDRDMALRMLREVYR